MTCRLVDLYVDYACTEYYADYHHIGVIGIKQSMADRNMYTKKGL